jgi:glycosyltransferase involved in cell wall biosynthesis
MRICVITSGHLATCPRMVKAADAFAEAGHTVRIVSTQFLDWAAEADRGWGGPPGPLGNLTSRFPVEESPAVPRPRRPSWTTVDYRRRTAPATYWRTRLEFHAARRWVRVVGADRASLAALAAANGRAARDLLKLALAEPADLFYGGTSGGLAIAALASRRTAAPYAIDLEDFHEGQFEDGRDCHRSRTLIRALQRQVLPAAAFVTAGSSAIAAQYERAYGIPVLPIHNTFPLPAQAPDPEPPGHGTLRLYWFSQTVGVGRGLEDVARAVALAGIRAELHLRGSARPEYIAALQCISPGKLAIFTHSPAPPDRMVELSRPYDVGLSPEEGRDLNRQLCLGNKALTYILGGLPVVLTDTPGQRPLADDLGEGALRYRSGDIPSLAYGLRRWAADRGLLRRARQAAWNAARNRWNWEDRREKGALLAAVEGAL